MFAFGVVLKQAGLLSSDDGGSLLRVVFNLGLPPLIFLSILHVDIDTSMLLLCVFGPAVIGVALVVVLLLRRTLLSHVDAKTFGPLLTGAVVMNTGFLLPFVERVLGADGLARLALIDTFVGMTVFTVVYAVVVHVAHDRPDLGFVFRKVALSPPLWGLAAGAVVKSTGVTPPAVLLDSFDIAARMVATAILVALALKFEWRVERPRLLLLVVALRFGVGAALGAAFVMITGLDGVNASIVMFASMAPVGTSSITFAEMEGLDVRFAASQVSVGLLLAMVASPLTVQLLD